jgi:hypothetical protein
LQVLRLVSARPTEDFRENGGLKFRLPPDLPRDGNGSFEPNAGHDLAATLSAKAKARRGSTSRSAPEQKFRQKRAAA